jgi:hypothetical protein
VIAADGAALADPGVRRVIDVIRPHIAPSLSCVIDAALASQAAALSASRTVGATIALVTPTPPHCAALSRVGDDVWIATTGDASTAPAPETSPGAVSRWQRARDYLDSAPIAVAIDLGGVHAVAGAQAQPFTAWLAVDATPELATAFEQQARAVVVPHVAVTRTGDQIVVRTAPEFTVADLDRLAPIVAALIDPPPVMPAPPDLPCPHDVHCADASHWEIAAFPDVVGDPVVAAGQVIGIRLTADAAFLRRGDVVLGVDGRPLRAPGKMPRAPFALAFRRDGVDRVVHITAAQ